MKQIEIGSNLLIVAYSTAARWFLVAQLGRTVGLKVISRLTD
jgi:hypothetical protein